MSRVLSGSLVTLCLMALSLQAVAQISPFKSSRSEPRLSATDLDLFGDSVRGLNKDPKLETGATAKWSNPATGSYGTSAVERIFTQGKRPCHTMHHEVFAQGRSPASTYDLTWCRTTKGEWKISS